MSHMGLVGLEPTIYWLKARCISRYATDPNNIGKYSVVKVLVVSQPPLKNTTEPVAGQVVCASSRSGPRHLESRSPTDSSNIPGFDP